MKQTNKQFWQKLTILAALSGILYNSWPLGYWLNPRVSKSQLASALEALHQPYNWVFSGGDVVSSLLIVLVCWLLWRHRQERRNRLLAAVLESIVIFAIGTIIDTLLPESCLQGSSGCQGWQHNPLLLAHGIFSIAASIGLFVALVILWWRQRRSWWLNGLMAGYVLFGLFSFLEAVTPAEGNWSQHYYIALCGVWLTLIPAAVCRVFTKRPA